MNICLFASTERDDLISGFIRGRTGCDQSHCGFFDLDSKLTYSAMCDGKGVGWRPIKPKQEMLYLQAPGMKEAFQWALTQLGKPYDWRAIVGIAFNRNIVTDGHFFCSYLVFQSFIQTNNPLLAHWAIPLEHLSPRDVLLSPKISQLEI